MLVELLDRVVKREIRRRFLSAPAKVIVASPRRTSFNYEADFDRMQHAYRTRSPEYGYDSLSAWRRAVNRATHLLDRLEIRHPGLNILDAGCGDSMLGVLLNSYGHRTTLVDATDWRDSRARNLPFFTQQLENLDQLPSAHFDLVCSYNTFEHLRDPRSAFKELLRVCKADGSIFLEFSPLYHGPWGLHAYHTLKVPYAQFLFSEQFIASKLRELGILDLGKELDQPQHLNRWKYSEFVALWSEHPDCHVISQARLRNEDHLDVILRYPRAFRGRRFDFLELTTQGIQVLLRRC